MYTPHISFNWFPSFQLFGMNSVARILAAYPLPRKDLERTVHVGSNQLNLTTSSKHIPDGFGGIGYALESPTKKWRIDIGATLDFLILEGNLRHKGTTKPIFLNYSFIL